MTKILLSKVDKTLRYIIMIALTLTSAMQSAFAMSPEFRNIATADGLSGLLVNVIYKDVEGFVWIGTDNGVDRFDGIRLSHHSFEGVGQSSKKRVTAIAMTANRQLWVGNALGLWLLDNDGLKRQMTDRIDAVNALLADGNTLYIGTDKGLFIQGEGGINNVQTANNSWATANHVTALCKDGKDLWITTQGGLKKLDTTTGHLSSWTIPSNNATDNDFKCLTKLGQTIYIGTSTRGLLTFNTATAKFANGPQVGCSVISSLSTDGGDMIYVATDGNGVQFISHSQQKVVESYKHASGGISSNSVYSLYVDERRMLWVGNYRSGLDYMLFQSDLFSTYSFLPQFSSENLTVNQFYIRGNEKMIGTRDGLFFIDESKGIVTHLATPQLPANIILSVAFYDDKYFIGTYGGGLITFDPATHKLEAPIPQLTSGHVFCLRTDAHSALWIGSSQGVWRWQGGKSMLFNPKNSQLPQGNVYDVQFDSQGRGWIGTENGLAIYDPAQGVVRNGIFPKGFADKDKIRRIYEDSRHNLYFIREKGNLFMSSLSMDKYGDVPLPIISPDNDNSVLSIAEDKRQNLWIACSDGLISMGAEGKTDAYDLFGYKDGLPSQTFTNNSVVIDEGGRLWFGNAKGLLCVNPDNAELKYRRHRKQVKISAVYVNGNVVEDLSTLRRGDNNIRFLFTDLNYSKPSSSVFEYKLEGYDDEWKLVSTTAEVTYYDLPSGSYTFKVRIPGNASTETSVSLRIKSSLTWIVFLQIAVGIAVAFIPAIRKRKRKQEIKEETVAPTPTAPIERQQDDQQKQLLTEKESEELKKRLVNYMKDSRPYTNKNLKSADVADALEVSVNVLSFVLNQYMHVSFSDFINEYRVNEFQRMASSDRYSNLTLTALSEKCGFGSQASFFRTFKKLTGITPNEYLRQSR